MNECGSFTEARTTYQWLYNWRKWLSLSPSNWDCPQSRMRHWRIQSCESGQTCFVFMIAMAMLYIGESHHSLSCPPGLTIFPPLVHDGLLFLVGKGGSERTWWCLNSPHVYSDSGIWYSFSFWNHEKNMPLECPCMPWTEGIVSILYILKFQIP